MPGYPRIGRRLVGVMLVVMGVFALSSCESTGPVPGVTPTEMDGPIGPKPDFAFVFEWSYCYTYTLNTFDNKLTLRSNVNPSTITTVDFGLSRQEAEEVFQKMEDIGFFGYPDEFRIQLPPDVVRLYGMAARYTFNVRNDSHTKVVRWNDEFSELPDAPWKAEWSEPGRTQAEKLRELVKLIRQIVEGHPEFRKLPSPGGCA